MKVKKRFVKCSFFVVCMYSASLVNNESRLQICIAAEYYTLLRILYIACHNYVSVLKEFNIDEGLSAVIYFEVIFSLKYFIIQNIHSNKPIER